MRIAVIGTGSIGRRHIANLLSLGVSEIVAVSEHGRRKSLDIGGADIRVVYSAGESMTTSDAVIVANPTSLHLDYLRMAVAAGRHVYVEKPASTCAVGLAEIQSEATKKGLVVAVGTQFRFNPRLREIKAAIVAKKLGRLIYARAHAAEHLADYHPGEDFRQSYAARAELGGGVLLTQIHQIDYLNWIFGPFESVFAAGGASSELGLDVEETATYLLTSTTGMTVMGHLDYLQRPKSATLEIYGTQGRMNWDYFDNSVVTQLSDMTDAVSAKTAFDRNAPFLACMKDFLDCARSGEKPEAGIVDAISSLAIVDAIKVSMKTSKNERLG